MSAVLIDANLLLLLVVGETDVRHIGQHKRLRHQYTEDDFELIKWQIAEYQYVVVLPHILAEVSSLLHKIENPARSAIRRTFCRLMRDCFVEWKPDSRSACSRAEYPEKGLTDALILDTCATWGEEGLALDLLTADEPLHNDAVSQGYRSELY